MRCLEYWFYMFLILLVGQLKKAKVAVAAASICDNLFGWVLMVFLGFNAAISMRVSNEHGAGRPRAASFQYLWCSCPQSCYPLLLTLVLVLKDVYGVSFTNSPKVTRVVSYLAVHGLCFHASLQQCPASFYHVAVGAKWQWLVAYINLGCHHVVGIPLGSLLAIKFDLEVKGMWTGMLTRVSLQTLSKGKGKGKARSISMLSMKGKGKKTSS